MALNFQDFASKIYTFKVGPNAKLFSVHADAFTKLSVALESLINGQPAAKWKHVSEETFISLCEFAYKGDYTSPVPAKRLNEAVQEQQTPSPKEPDEDVVVVVKPVEVPPEPEVEKVEVKEFDDWGCFTVSSKKPKNKPNLRFGWDEPEEIPAVEPVEVPNEEPNQRCMDGWPASISKKEKIMKKKKKADQSRWFEPMPMPEPEPEPEPAFDPSITPDVAIDEEGINTPARSETRSKVDLPGNSRQGFQLASNEKNLPIRGKEKIGQEFLREKAVPLSSAQDFVRACAVRSNETSETFEAVLQAHAQLYLLAVEHVIESLRILCLDKIRRILFDFKVTDQTILDVLPLINLTYKSTGENDDLRKLLADFICWRLDDDDIGGRQALLDLVSKGGDFARLLFQHVYWRRIAPA